MATFTMELRNALPVIPSDWLDEYPIFDPDYRELLNSKIIEHFHYREIGVETIDQFVFLFKRKMNEIMPLYNQRYKSELLKIDPLITFRSESDSTSTGTATGSTSGTNTAHSSSESNTQAQGYNSIYPQTNILPDGVYEDSGARQNSDSTATTESDGSESATQSSEQESTGRTTAEGFAGSMSAMLMEYRETFLNIDMEVISELESLFMLVWDNGDSFFGHIERRFPYYFMGWF